MRVRIIKEDFYQTLEYKLNNELRNKDVDDIHDIKLCLETNHPVGSVGNNYAMIIYK